MQLAEGLRATQNLFPGAKREKHLPNSHSPSSAMLKNSCPASRRKSKGGGKRAELLDAGKKGYSWGHGPSAVRKFSCQNPNPARGCLRSVKCARYCWKEASRALPLPFSVHKRAKPTLTDSGHQVPRLSTGKIPRNTARISASRLSWITLSWNPEDPKANFFPLYRTYLTPGQ